VGGGQSFQNLGQKRKKAEIMNWEKRTTGPEEGNRTGKSQLGLATKAKISWALPDLRVRCSRSEDREMLQLVPGRAPEAGEDGSISLHGAPAVSTAERETDGRTRGGGERPLFSIENKAVSRLQLRPTSVSPAWVLTRGAS
jgi:hypothetical protein